jgi:hypothetical protein
MMQRQFVESLEARKVLASAAGSVVTVGDTGGVTASAAAINVTQRTIYFNAVQGQTNTQTLRITNTGDRNLVFAQGAVTLTGANSGAFSVVDFPTDTFGLRSGRRLDIQIAFNAPNTTAVQTAQLVINTNDPNQPQLIVNLRALPTKGEGGSLEPSLQKVVNAFGWQIDTGDGNAEDYLYGTPTGTSDEVVMQSLKRANASLPVTIRPLAMFGSATGPAVRLGTYTPGSPDDQTQLWYVPRESAQSLNPIVYGQTAINPGNEPFALFTEWPGFYNAQNGTTREVYSEDSLNTWDTNASARRKMRFFPFVDARGEAVANTYLVAVEEWTQEYDQQDLLFVVTNVQKADGKPTISVLSKDDRPGNGRLVFNKVQIPNPDVTDVTKLDHTVTVSNTGTAPLVVNFSTTGNFSITSGGGTNQTIAPGASRTLNVRFTATGGGLHNGTLVMTSNDTDKPTVTVRLAGFWQEYSEQPPAGSPNTDSDEPTSQVIVNDLFGYTTALTNPGQTLENNGLIQTVGDEILSPYWLAADDNAYVRITQIASYHGVTYVASNGQNEPTQTFTGYYYQDAPGTKNTLMRHEDGHAQTVLPGKDNSTSNLTTGQFRATSDRPFGFVVENLEHSDPAINRQIALDNGVAGASNPNFGHFVRFWPAYDGEGKIIPNTYIMLHDYNRAYTNYDFNDNIYIVENIKPVNALKSPLTLFAEETSRGARISFTGPGSGPRILGFNVYRSSSPRGVYELLTDQRLPRRPIQTFIDETSVASDTYYYKIVSVGANGVESAPVMVII